MTTDIVPVNGINANLPMPSVALGMDLRSLGSLLAKSGYVKDTQSEAQAVFKILYGAEVGIPPVSALMGIHIIDTKPTFSANLMATVIQRSGRYRYEIRRLDNQVCELEFFDGRRLIGESTFTMEDAKAAELAHKPIWKRYPRNMLLSRAISNGFRWYCAELSGGAPVYTPEELGADVDGDTGEYIDVQPQRQTARPKPAPEPQRQSAGAFGQPTATLRTFGEVCRDLGFDAHATCAALGVSVSEGVSVKRAIAAQGERIGWDAAIRQLRDYRAQLDRMRAEADDAEPVSAERAYDERADLPEGEQAALGLQGVAVEHAANTRGAH